MRPMSASTSPCRRRIKARPLAKMTGGCFFWAPPRALRAPKNELKSVTVVTLRFTYALRYGWHLDYVTLRPPYRAYVRNARNV